MSTADDRWFISPSEQLDIHLCVIVAARPGQYAAPPSLLALVIRAVVRDTIPLPERSARRQRWAQQQGRALERRRWN